MTLDYNRSLVADKMLLELGPVVDIFEFRDRSLRLTADRCQARGSFGHWPGDVTKLERRILLTSGGPVQTDCTSDKKILTRSY